MVAPNQNSPSNDRDKLTYTRDWYASLAAEFMCRGVVGMTCPCKVCAVTCTADSVLGVVAGATVKALEGKPAMLNELMTFVAKLTTKYPA